MGVYQAVEFRILHGTIREVHSECENENNWTAWLSDGVYQQVNELPPLVFRGRQREQFLKLVDEQHNFGPLWFRKSSRIEMEATRRIVFQIFTNRFQALSCSFSDSASVRDSMGCT